MKINYNVTGSARKSLVGAISHELNAPVKYLGMPTAAYEVGGYHIDKTGTVTGEDNRELVADLQGLHSFVPASEEYDAPLPEVLDAPAFGDLTMTAEKELGMGRQRRDPWGEDGMQASDVTKPDRVYPAGCTDGLYAPGYVPECHTYQAELSAPECPDRMEVFTADNDEDALRQAREFCTGEIVLLELFLLNDDYDVVRSVEIKPNRLILQMPLTGFAPEKIDNLCKLVSAKAALIKMALGAEDLPIRQTPETLNFPWFEFTDDAETVEAYSTLVSLLCKTAKEKKRVTAKEKAIEGSPKYAMRCFLLSLGMIGDEYKVSRRILLAKMEGSAAFKDGERRQSEALATNEGDSTESEAAVNG